MSHNCSIYLLLCSDNQTTVNAKGDNYNSLISNNPSLETGAKKWTRYEWICFICLQTFVASKPHQGTTVYSVSNFSSKATCFLVKKIWISRHHNKGRRVAALTHLLVSDANSFHDDGRQLSERRACDGVRRRVFGEVEPVRRMKKLWKQGISNKNCPGGSLNPEPHSMHKKWVAHE